MRELRAAHRPVGRDELARGLWPDADAARARRSAGLVADGLAVADDDGLRLPDA